MFGRKVSLTYDGNKKFKTLFGGVMTIVVISLMGLFLYVICSHTTTITLSNMTSYLLSTTGNLISLLLMTFNSILINVLLKFDKL